MRRAAALAAAVLALLAPGCSGDDGGDEGAAAREVQDRWMAGDRAGAAAALTPELIDSSAVCCRPAELEEHLAEYERAGATTFLAMPFGDRAAIVDQLASAIQTP